MGWSVPFRSCPPTDTTRSLAGILSEIVLLAMTKSLARETPELLCGQHRVDALLLHQDHDELCWIRRARVAPDRVHVVGAFVETLSWRQGYLLAAPDPFDDRPFQHIDEGVRIVTMDVLDSSGRILDGEHQHLPSGHVSKILLHDGGHNWLRRSVRRRC